MVAGESKSPGRQHLLELADTFGIKNAKAIIDEVQTTIADWDILSKDSGVSDASRKIIGKTLTEISKE
jgi:serine/threonine-protein kinase HipA